MKIIDNILYLDFDDATQCGLGSENYISKEKSRGANWAVFIKDPKDSRKVLIEFESLPQKKKDLVVQQFGNPYEYYSKAPIRQMVIKDGKAEDFYFNYRYDDNKALPDENREKYTTAASWLNMLIKAQDDFRTVKKELSITAAKFWMQVGELIESDNVSLPSEIRRLAEKIKKYKADGYASLIHKHFGNSYARKVDNEVSQALLLELVSMPNADDHVTARRYNHWAAENNKQQISARTVTNWKLENKHLISLDKYGVRENYNSFGKHIPRRRPSAPLLLVEHDDNELDLYFQSSRTKKGRTEVYYWNRFVLAVVIDAYNDYILGWAVAETYTKELIRFAYLDAAHHIKELTGAFYFPHQIRSDRFGLDAKASNDLGQFYKSIATYTPATVKVARSKYIERSFGISWHQALGCYPNYAGTNITSKTHLNQDYVELQKKDFPSVEQAPVQIAQFINTMRHLVTDKTGLSRQEQWIKGFNESELSKKYLTSEIVMLSKLGQPHHHLNKITNRGITPAINCTERTYEIPEELYLKTIGKTVQVIYDRMDYSRILVTNQQDLHFIAREIELMPSALADFKKGDREKLNDRLEQKVRHMQVAASAKKDRQDTLQLARIEIDSLAKAGVHTKAINHKIQLGSSPVAIPEMRIVEEDNSNEPYDPLDQL